MPIPTFKNVAAEADSSVTSASFAVVAGDLIVVRCGSDFSDATLPVLNIGITDTLGSLSWTEVTAEDHSDAGYDNVTSIFYATAGATSPGTVTVTTTGATCDATWLRVDTVSGWTAVTNTKAQSYGYLGVGTNIVLTFTSPPAATSLCMIACTIGTVNYNSSEEVGPPNDWELMTKGSIALASPITNSTNMQYWAIDKNGNARTVATFDPYFDAGAASIVGIEITVKVTADSPEATWTDGTRMSWTDGVDAVW